MCSSSWIPHLSQEHYHHHSHTGQGAPHRGKYSTYVFSSKYFSFPFHAVHYPHSSHCFLPFLLTAHIAVSCASCSTPPRRHLFLEAQREQSTGWLNPRYKYRHFYGLFLPHPSPNQPPLANTQHPLLSLHTEMHLISLILDQFFFLFLLVFFKSYLSSLLLPSSKMRYPFPIHFIKLISYLCS